MNRELKITLYGFLVLIFAVYLILFFMLIVMPKIWSSAEAQTSNNNNNNITRVVMLNFDDGYADQYLLAKPILDKYGFKATFFIPCAKMETKPDWMTWQMITALGKDDGMDIESHTMTHAHLDFYANNDARLLYEIAGSRQCLADHGFDSSLFAYPLGVGDNITKIVNLVSKNYIFARSGTEKLFTFNCSGYTRLKGVPLPPQSDCRTFDQSGKLTYANRYDIRADSFRHITNIGSFTEQQMLQRFIAQIQSQDRYNSGGQIKAVPIITYHDLTTNIQKYDAEPSTILMELFEAEMKYLHDNNIKVMLMTSLGFNTDTNTFFLQQEQQ